MKRALRGMLVAAVLGWMLLAVTGADAQYRRRPYRAALPARPAPAVGRFNYNPNATAPYYALPTPALPTNPNYLVGPGLTVRQAAYNQALMNYGTYANTPYQWYNPFINNVNYGTSSYYPYASSYYSPSYSYGYGGY